MFTGIIRHKGVIRGRESVPGGERLLVENAALAVSASNGDSIAVDGCCLTVTSRDGAILKFDLSTETLRRTIAAHYREGAAVNLEASLKLGDTLGGHFVTGHVDTVGHVVRLTPEGEFATLVVEISGARPGLVAEKGSISVNGVSLTVAAWHPHVRVEEKARVEAALVPETLERTNLGILRTGLEVNIEFDLIARHVAEYLSVLHLLPAPTAS